MMALPALARAAEPITVAVMPFQDLSRSGSAVGEAIRETVTADLASAAPAAGLRVVERARLDGVLREQRLQAAAGELDVPGAVKVGRLVGASLIVTGAYQKVGASVRLTARFVKVETGVIVGTAKVDGAAVELLTLEDRVTAELARSAGFKYAERARPRLKSYKTMELYGDAVVEPAVEKRRALLEATVREDPGFVYAAHDLDALEKRVQALGQTAERELERVGLERVAAKKRAIGAASDGKAEVDAWEALFDELHEQLRFRRLLDEARTATLEPPARVKADPALADRLRRRALWEYLLCLGIFRDRSGAILREGERFLAEYPTSPHFADVKTMIAYAVRRERMAEEGPRKAREQLDHLDPAARANPCTAAHIYEQNRDPLDATRSYEACIAGPHASPQDEIRLLSAYIGSAQFKLARRFAQRLRDEQPGLLENLRDPAFDEIPIDGD
jgi:TolB-like protein